MKFIEGKVNNIRFSTEISGGESTTTKQLAVCDLGSIACEIRSHDQIIINEGDDVVFVGHKDEGVFVVLAYKNKHLNIARSCSQNENLFIGILLLAFGIATIPALIGLLIIPFGWKFIKTHKAYEEAYEIAKNF